MTPKEKAGKIYNSMYKVKNIIGDYPMTKTTAKQCSLIAVDEILKISYFTDENRTEEDDMYKNYWVQVKEEIEKL